MTKHGFTPLKTVQFFLLGALAWAAAAAPLAGRIGERQAQFEDRLLVDGTAQRMQPPDIAALVAALRASAASTSGTSSSAGSGRRGFGRGFGNGGQRMTYGEVPGFDITSIDTLLWQSIGQTLPDPDSNGVRKRPPDFPVYVYFKTDDGTPAAKKLQSTEPITGWELQIYLYKQLSGLEVYRRIGTPLSDAEVSAILSANRGGASWTRGNAQANTVALPDDDNGASFIGFDFERTDGQVRAAKVGNDLVIYSTDLDKALIKVRDALNRAAVEGKGAGGPGANVFNSTRGF